MLTFKSPAAKLIEFFRRSRDGWKAKHQAVKQENKKLANQVRAVEKSREQWRQTARSAQQHIRELE
jgi:hypothetical protein